MYEFKINEDTVNLIFVTDNGANLAKGLRNDTHLRCACQCLNLAIEYGLSNSSEELTSIIDSCRKLVAHFKRAGLQKQLDGISLKQQVSTRWNSLFTMFESIMINYNDIEVILEERSESDFLFDVNLGILKHLTEFLKVFKQASEELSADDSPTLHLLVSWFYYLKDYSKVNLKEPLIIRLFKSYVSNWLEGKVVLTEYYRSVTIVTNPERGFLTVNRAPLYCTISSSKSQKFKYVSSRRKTENYSGCQKPSPYIRYNNMQPETEESISEPKKNRLDISQQFMNRAKKKDEVIAYERAQFPVIDNNQCVLEWWTNNGNMFPSVQVWRLKFYQFLHHLLLLNEFLVHRVGSLRLEKVH